MKTAIIAMIAIASLSAVSAQQPAPKGLAPNLGRPTSEKDTTPTFDFDYFLGTWTFEWEMPDSVLGPGGTLTGKTTYTRVDDAFYAARTEGAEPDGPLLSTELIAYRKENKTAARHVSDARGFAYLQMATVGGNLGGYYNVYYESAPFLVKGKTVRLKHYLHVTGPTQYRVATSISVDGAPYMKIGTPWFAKHVPGTSGR